MRIVYISKSKIPSRIANSIHVMYMCDALAGLGHEVTLLAPDFKDLMKVDNIYTFYGVKNGFVVRKLIYPDFKGKSCFYGIHVAKTLMQIKPDLVIGRSEFGCMASAEMGFPTVFDSHGPVWEGGWLSLKLFKMMINRRSFKRMTVNSNALKMLYERSAIFKESTFDPEKIVVAYNGSNHFPLEDYVELPGEKGKKRVGYFGHLYKGRGIEMIMAMAAQLKDINFYVVGGEEQDINYWKKKVTQGNIFFLGFIPYPEVYKYRNSCDILLAPYQKVVSPEGASGDQSHYMNPIKIIEYMSSRKPIIASGLQTIREVLNDNNAILADCENIEEWIAGIKKLIGNTLFSTTLAENAYRDFVDHFTWKIRASKLAAVE